MKQAIAELNEDEIMLRGLKVGPQPTDQEITQAIRDELSKHVEVINTSIKEVGPPRRFFRGTYYSEKIAIALLKNPDEVRKAENLR